MVVALTEVMPAEVRVAGFSLAYSLATALFGGFTPADSTWLIAHNRRQGRAGLLAELRGVCGFFATLALYRKPSSGLQYAAPSSAPGG